MLALGVLAACVTKDYYVYMTPLEVDKDKGLVKMSYSYNRLQNPIVDYNVALKDASFQCRLAGYETARITEEFSYGCLDQQANDACEAYQVVIGYRCLTHDEVIKEAEDAAKGIGHTQVEYVPAQ